MKYNSVKIASHPRSGSHWVMRVIDLNFFKGNDYLKHYGGHPFGTEPRATGYFKPKQAVIYTWRNISHAVQSVYKMRQRFGLDEDNYNRFLCVPMKDMYSRKLKVDTVRDTLTEVKNETEVDFLFRGRTETVGEYIRKHMNSWKVHNNKVNFMMVCYDNLASDFQGTMLEVAQFLGSDRTEFVDEPTRVGWRDRTDNAWEKPGNSTDSK